MKQALVTLAIAALAPAAVHAQQGGFDAPQTLAVATSQLSDFEATDIDNDGDVDFSYAEAAAIRIRLNFGGGSFGPPLPIITSFNTIIDIEWHDFDSDGDLDLIVADKSSGQIAYHENLGFGFIGPGSILTGNLVGVEKVVVGDYDNDQRPDVIASGDHIKVAPNTGFGPSTLLSTNLNNVYTDRRIALGDFDGDGELDVARSGSPSYVNTGWWISSLGTFWGAASNQTVYPTVLNHLTIADIDNDGDLDLLGTTGNQIRILRCAGLGSTSYTISSLPPGLGNGWASLATADLGADGQEDIVGIHYGALFAFVCWMANDGSGTFGMLRTVALASSDTIIRIADLDGDGMPDILHGGGNSAPDQIVWQRNTMLPATSSSYGSGCGTPPLDFVATANAAPGLAASATIYNTPTPLCIVGGGTSNSSMPGIGALPFDLSSIGMAGCMLNTSSNVVGLATYNAGAAFQMQFDQPIPAVAQLIGQHFYFQAFCLAPGVNPLEVISSNGIDFLIGDQ
jgi:hypothetical protein